MTDERHGQKDVAASVTVKVESVQPNQVHYLTPLTMDATSDSIVRQRSQVRGKQQQQQQMLNMTRYRQWKIKCKSLVLIVTVF